MPRNGLIVLGVVLAFLAICVWQKATAWEDRYRFNGDTWMVRMESADWLLFTHPDSAQDFQMSSSSCERDPLAVTIHLEWESERYVRDWTYFPPYLR